FFFQAEDGIRDFHVTGVQTCALPILYVIGVAKDIAQGMVKLDALTAANAVTVISIANLSGRLVLGILSDKIARIRVITLGQVVSLVGMAALLFAPLNEATFLDRKSVV